ncbi:MAG: cupin domain-containing protein [Leptospiraceae bacterium]|nr:cupin domain-containing protein [Leptospiraceae bacterium]
MVFSIFSIGCSHNERHPERPSKVPVERHHFDELPLQTRKFKDGSSPKYKVLIDKEEITVLLFFLKSGEEIPLHTHSVDKAIYVYNGNPEILIKEKMTPTVTGDSLLIPKNSGVKIKNTNKGEAKIFFFFSKGFLNSLAFQSPKEDSDKTGMKNVFYKEKDVPWENWDGKLPLGSKPTPLAWKTIIDNDTMVMGITKIDPGYDVDSHYHRPTQIVIFSDGEGKTHVENGEYKEIKKDSYIYPPTYTMHHSINTHKKKPLMEIYFFPLGPFAKIKYLGKGVNYYEKK